MTQDPADLARMAEEVTPAEWAMPGHLDKDKLARWQRWLENHPKRAHAICVHMNEASGWDKKVCQPRWK